MPGMAAGPLACFLYDEMGARKRNFIIEQGHFMEPASPRVIEVRLQIENGSVSGWMAGGKATVVKTQAVEMPKRSFGQTSPIERILNCELRD